ncbi:MAG TPA: polysaccharide deacetylase family protein [Steroidobacteraceae bacterium]|nr:polysaccharide deacetylase family protein [Steroidobacteraceae bacterium]HRX89246.1 polysaccharide deacetylase family protein [Steroidobacteraceae bacterium]
MSALSRAGWSNGARLALSLVVNVEEGAEQNIRDGDRGPDPVDELGIVLKTPVRNFGNESNYEYGIREGGPRVLDLLAKYQMRATFTASAMALERAPQLAERIVADGHEVCAHGYRWQAQLGMSIDTEREFIAAAVRSITQTCGQRPVGWLSRYLHTENTRQLLAEAGFRYHMDDFSRDEPWVDRSVKPPLLVLPYALDSNDMKLWSAPALTPDAWFEYARASFDWLYSEGARRERLMMSLGVHLRIIGRPGRIVVYEKFLRHVAAAGDVWIATRQDIAASSDCASLSTT